MPQPLPISAGDITLAAERHSGSGPVVVLLHAGVCDRRSWREVAALLADEGLDVVSYDRRGFGETGPSGASFRHLDDLAAVLDQVSPEPAWLVGSSMGGGLALDAALELDGRVAGLVLLAPAVSGAPEPEDAAYGEATVRIGEAIEVADEAGDVAEVNRLEALLWLDGPDGPEGRVGGEARELLLVMNGIALESGMDEDAGASGVDAWARLEEVRVPTAVGCGDLDLPPIIARARDVADRVADTRAHETFPGTAHLPYLERPADVARYVHAAITG